MNKKKIMMIVVAIVLALAIIAGGATWWMMDGKNRTAEGQTQQQMGASSKISKIYTELEQKQTYQVTLKLDDTNEIFYAKKDGKAYIDTKYQGQNSKFIVRDGNSYLLVEDRKTYYTYQNNETDLGKIEAPLETAKNSKYEEGKEKIENKEYKYEEYEGITDFLVKDVEKKEEQTVKTRFYFNGDKLVYIKTIVGDYQETIKVDITYTVDDKLFEIPTDYKEA